MTLKTIRRWRDAGRLPAVEISPRVYRYRREDVEALLGGAVASERQQDLEAHVLAARRKLERLREVI